MCRSRCTSLLYSDLKKDDRKTKPLQILIKIILILNFTHLNFLKLSGVISPPLFCLPSREREEILLIASCYGNQDKLQPDGPTALAHMQTFLTFLPYLFCLWETIYLPLPYLKGVLSLSIHLFIASLEGYLTKAKLSY